MNNLIVYNSPFEKMRIGSNADGGYVTAKLPDGYDLFISGGIAKNVDFEEHFLRIHSNIKGYGFDGTINNLPRLVNKFTFIKKNLGNANNNNSTNLVEYIQKHKNIFMKIDIEGHEFRVMPEIIKNDLMQNIKQIVIEIHTPFDIQLYPKYFKGLSDINNSTMFKLLSDFNKTHTIIHFHANNGCKMAKYDNIKIPHVFELTYIRNDFMKEKVKNNEPLPTKLEADKVLVVLFHVRFGDCKIDVAALPIKI
jgi:hypothetical protein